MSVPPCPRCGELDLVSRDAGCGRCNWYEGSNDPRPSSRPFWWWLLVVSVTVTVFGLLLLAVLDPH